MVSYVLRRLGVSLLILLGASFLVYQLVAVSGDPLLEFRESTKPNRDQLMAQRTALLHLDVPAPARYFIWLSGVVKCVVPGRCDLGKTIQGQPVTSGRSGRAPWHRSRNLRRTRRHRCPHPLSPSRRSTPWPTLAVPVLRE